MAILLASVLAQLSAIALAIGPNSNLHIANQAISPDGFSRSCVSIQTTYTSLLISYL